MKISDIDKADIERFYVPGGDTGFSEKWNNHIIDKTIRDTEANIKRKQKAYDDRLGERVDAVASYLRSKVINSNTPIEKYLGKRNLAYLQGKRIVETMRNGVVFLSDIESDN